MTELLPVSYQLAWPFALALAWIAGEFGHRWTGLPRISIYGLAGFLFGNLASGYLPQSESDTFMLLANVGFGLILFELGYRINLRWLRANPWIAVMGVAEAAGTFSLVHWWRIGTGRRIHRIHRAPPVILVKITCGVQFLHLAKFISGRHAQAGATTTMRRDRFTTLSSGTKPETDSPSS